MPCSLYWVRACGFFFPIWGKEDYQICLGCSLKIQSLSILAFSICNLHFAYSSFAYINANSESFRKIHITATLDFKSNPQQCWRRYTKWFWRPFFLFDMCTCVCLHVGLCTWAQWLWKPGEAIWSPELELQDFVNRPTRVLGTKVLWEDSKGS